MSVFAARARIFEVLEGMAANVGLKDRSKVLVVDDDPGVRALLVGLLSRCGYEPDAVSDGASALTRLDARSYDAIVTDIHMPSLGGLELLRAIRQRDLDVAVVLVTGLPDFESAVAALEYGAFRYLVKPLDLEVVKATAGRAITMTRMARMRREAAELLGGDGLQLGDRAALDARFANALSALWIAFQPIVHLPTRSVYGYEALMRSDEPSLGTPAGLLDAAQRLGREHELGRAVRAAVAELASDAPEGVSIFVNVNADELNDNEILSATAPLARHSARVVLEVTERAALHRVDGLMLRRQRLRELGYRIAVDDLGAGYAGLSSFSVLDPEVVKLDMSLVRGVDTDARKLHVVAGIARLCESLDLKVVCEGVETPGELDALQSAGITLAQGYLFARPARGFPEPSWP